MEEQKNEALCLDCLTFALEEGKKLKVVRKLKKKYKETKS
jgi:hypothetical protein